MLSVNGKVCEYKPEMTVRDLLKSQNFIFPLLVVRINGTYVPREEYDSTKLCDGAVVDVIHLMSGG